MSRPHVEIAIAYLAGYVLLDWLSYVHPYAAFGITPWNPPTGLSFALILLFGVEFLRWLFIAPVLADGFVRGFALPSLAELAAGAIIGGGYTAATALLLMPRLRFDAALTTRRLLLFRRRHDRHLARRIEVEGNLGWPDYAVISEDGNLVTLETLPS